MNGFLGLNCSAGGHILCRHDNQLLALNYENLCDAEYLDRLFTSQSGEQVDKQGHSTALKDNESWILSADTAEDVIVFGSDPFLGKRLMLKRYLAGIATSVSSHDILSTLVQRQIIVFERIGRLIEASCLQQEALLKKSIEGTCRNSESTKLEMKPHVRNHVASEALCCALRALAKHSRNQLQRSAVDPIITLLLRMYQERGSHYLTGGSRDEAPRVDDRQLQHLREVLCNGVEHGIELFAACTQTADVKQNEEHLKLCLSCAYGLLAVGIYAKGVGDVMMALLQIVSISLLLNEFQSLLLNDRELESFTLSSIERSLDAVETPKLSTDQPLLNEYEDQQKLNLKLKVKLKVKDSGTNLFPIINKFSANASTTSSITTCETKLSVTSNDFLDQQKLKKIKAGKWDAVNCKSGAIKVLDKAKESHLTDRDTAKLRIQLVRSRLYGDEDFPSNTTSNPTNSTRKNAPKKMSSIPGCGNNNEDRNSPDFDDDSYGTIQSPSQSHGFPLSLTPQLITGRKSHRQEESNQAVVVSSATETHQNMDVDDRNIDTFNALRISFKNLSRIPKSVLRIVLDGCAEQQAEQKRNTKPYGEEIPSSRSTNPSKSYVWSCGQNSYGELGHCDGSLRKTFSKINFLEGKGVVSVGAGNEHSIFVCNDGKVFVTGYNDNGQCGNGKTEQVKSPQQVTALAGEDIAKVFVFNGCEHTLVTTRDGKLYSFGYNYRGQVSVV